jgi:hypothetical protein
MGAPHGSSCEAVNDCTSASAQFGVPPHHSAFFADAEDRSNRKIRFGLPRPEGFTCSHFPRPALTNCSNCCSAFSGWFFSGQ